MSDTETVVGVKVDGPPPNAKEPEVIVVPSNDEAPYGRGPDGKPLDKNGDPAPYGLKKDGTAAKKRGRSAGSGGSPRSSSSSSGKRKGTDYRPGIIGLASIPSGILTAAGMATSNDEMLADAVAINHYVPGIAEALNDMAQDNAQLAGLLERALSTGPYAALFMATMPLIAQIATNHGALPLSTAAMMGAQHHPESLAKAAKADIVRMQATHQAREAEAEYVRNHQGDYMSPEEQARRNNGEAPSV